MPGPDRTYDTSILTRVTYDWVDRLDAALVLLQGDRERPPSRSEAIRILVTRGLDVLEKQEARGR